MGCCGPIGRFRGVWVTESELGLSSWVFWSENLCELKRFASLTIGLNWVELVFLNWDGVCWNPVLIEFVLCIRVVDLPIRWFWQIPFSYILLIIMSVTGELFCAWIIFLLCPLLNLSEVSADDVDSPYSSLLPHSFDDGSSKFIWLECLLLESEAWGAHTWGNYGALASPAVIVWCDCFRFKLPCAFDLLYSVGWS